MHFINYFLLSSISVFCFVLLSMRMFRLLRNQTDGKKGDGDGDNEGGNNPLPIVGRPPGAPLSSWLTDNIEPKTTAGRRKEQA